MSIKDSAYNRLEEKIKQTETFPPQKKEWQEAL